MAVRAFERNISLMTYAAIAAKYYINRTKFISYVLSIDNFMLYLNRKQSAMYISKNNNKFEEFKKNRPRCITISCE